MLRWLRLLTSPAAREASASAKALVASNRECAVEGVALRADELDRWVFAVFYRGRRRCKPLPYKLIAVTKDSKEATCLNGAEANRYRLRGYK